MVALNPYTRMSLRRASGAPDDLGQLTRGERFWANDSPVDGQRFDYVFDDIGNRVTSEEAEEETSYATNLLNQITGRTNPRALFLRGHSDSAAAVTVNATATSRTGDAFFGSLIVGGTDARMEAVTVESTLPGAGSGSSDAVKALTDSLYVPPASESLTYDEDGNLLQDGRFDYTWDGENRLLSVTTRDSVTNAVRFRAEYLYDGLSRRVLTLLSVFDEGENDFVLWETRQFVWDGWTLLREIRERVAETPVAFHYVWGLDVTGTTGGAGGVGGLLAILTEGEAHYTAYDGNGNVMALWNPDSEVWTADYTYDPFGRLIESQGEFAGTNRFRFSTKYQEPLSGLLYYGFRFYDTQNGRWVNRDPIEEQGGLNLYAFVGNDPVGKRDLLGLVTFEQVNEIADQMGITPISPSHANATETIKAIQSALGFQRPNGDFGPATVARYEKWAAESGRSPVRLRDPKTPKEVLDWIVAHWPNQHKCAPQCPVYYGEFLAIIFYESMDFSTRPVGSQQPVYFNAVGGPYASRSRGRLIGTTAVGLAQFTEATAPRSIAYDGEQSIKYALQLMFNDAANFNCNFTPTRNERMLQRGLNRWEAYRTQKTNINRMGRQINNLIRVTHKGNANAVSDQELRNILGMP